MFVSGSGVFCLCSQGSYMKVVITGSMPSTLSPPCFTHFPMSLSLGSVIIARHSASSTKLEAPLRTGCRDSRPSTFASESAQSRSSAHGHRTNDFNHMSFISYPSVSLSNLKFIYCYIAQAVLDFLPQSSKQPGLYTHTSVSTAQSSRASTAPRFAHLFN